MYAQKEGRATSPAKYQILDSHFDCADGAGTIHTEPFSSVWDAIEDTPELRENLKVRSVLMMELKGYMKRTGLGQSQAASLFGVTQPRVSDLVRGKIDLFSIDALVNMASAAGLQIEMRVREAP